MRLYAATLQMTAGFPASGVLRPALVESLVHATGSPGRGSREHRASLEEFDCPPNDHTRGPSSSSKWSEIPGAGHVCECRPKELPCLGPVKGEQFTFDVVATQVKATDRHRKPDHSSNGCQEAMQWPAQR
jgi:hypothetical protein